MAKALEKENAQTSVSPGSNNDEAELSRVRDELRKSNDRVVNSTIEIGQLKESNIELRAVQRATLNLMEDAVEARALLQHANDELSAEIVERKLIQKALQISEKRFRDLLENLPAAAYTCDSEGLITYFNQRALELWGRAPKLNDPEDKFCGSFRLFEPDGSPIKHEECWMALALRKQIYYDGREIVIERADGSCITALAHAGPLHDESGSLIGAVNVLVDVTERKEAEKAQARLVAIVESSDDAIIGKDLSGIVTSWNRGAEKIFGYTADEMTGKSITILMAPDRIDEEPLILERIRRGETIEHYETVRRRKDGTEIDISLTVSPIQDSTGIVIGASKVARDITERKRAEEALRESEEKFRTLAATAPALIWFDDPQGNCLYANKQYFEFHGRPEEDIRGTDWQMILHPVDAAAYINDFQAALTERRPFHHRVRAKRYDDEWRWLESYARPLFAEDGTFLGHVGISTDITESVEAEEELREASELLEARVEERTQELNRANALLLKEMSERQKAEEDRASLLAKIVTTQEEERRRIALDLHDHLGQRLTGLRLKIASLKEECVSDGQLRSQVEKLEELGALLDSDVNFLAWELRPKALDDLGLVSAVENYVQEWSRHSGILSEFHSGIVRTRRFASDIETNLYRITQEALNNAHKHGTARAANVILELRDDTIILIIEDDGKGFDPVERERAESRRGLGLIGMRERAASVGGTIEIESKPGSGTAVFVKVPAVFKD